MVLSNEPGYYETDSFGIRIENLVCTVRADTKHNFNERPYLTFENLTMVPYQTKMVLPELLTAGEVNVFMSHRSRKQFYSNCILNNHSALS